MEGSSHLRRCARSVLLGFVIVLLLAPTAAAARTGSIVTGLGAGAAPQVGVFDGVTGLSTYSFLAFAPGFAGGVRVAAGDVTGDGVPDIVTGAGPGGSAHVKVFDGVTGSAIRSFFAFPGFTGAVVVAAGDVNGDGRADLVVGADAGGAPHVKVFDAVTGAELRSFFAYAPGFAGGVRVAAGDVNGDGVADIVTGAGPGALPHLKVFDGATGAEIHSFFALGAGATGGVFVAAGDINGDGKADLYAGADEGLPPHVVVYDAVTGTLLRSFFAYAPGFTGGVRVAAGDVNGDGVADIVTGAGPGSLPHVKAFDGVTTAEFQSFFAASPASGGVYVAAAGPFGFFDTTDPVLSLPDDLDVPATGPAGAVVRFAASATDDVDTDVPVICAPASGSTFPIGDTTVECTATDAADNVARGSFVVHVRAAREQLDDLNVLVVGFDLDGGLNALLQNRVAQVERALANGDDACARLNHLLRTAIAKAGTDAGDLSFADAQQLLAAANRVAATLGCLPAESSLPAVQRDLVELMQTIAGLGVGRGEANALQEKARRAADAAVDAPPCATLDRLAAKIDADSDRPNRLTPAQGATLAAAVAAIRAEAGCA